MKRISPFIPAVCATMFRGQQTLCLWGVLLYWICGFYVFTIELELGDAEHFYGNYLVAFSFCT